MHILFEDQDLLVLNKPAGVVVNRADTVAEETIQEWMEERLGQATGSADDWSSLVPADFKPEFGSPEEIFAERGGMVHRLDKDTSGALVWAKNPGSLVNLLAQFKQRTVKKTYRCLVHGKLELSQGEINAPLGRSSRDRQKFAVESEGRAALTRYQVEEFYPHLDVIKVAQDYKEQPVSDQDRVKNFAKRAKIYQGFSLVTCWPQTGRTHQIRVHFKHLGHPLVGDTTYLGHKRAKLDPVWCPRQFLHASQVEVTHPRTGERLSVTAPLAPDLQQILNSYLTFT